MELQSKGTFCKGGGRGGSEEDADFSSEFEAANVVSGASPLTSGVISASVGTGPECSNAAVIP